MRQPSPFHLAAAITTSILCAALLIVFTIYAEALPATVLDRTITSITQVFVIACGAVMILIRAGDG